MAGVRIANVGVVPSEVIVLRVVSDLNETAQVAGVSARQEYGGILGHGELPVLGGRLGLIEAGVGYFDLGREGKE